MAEEKQFNAGFAEGEQNRAPIKTSREVRKVRKVMKGGNEESEANGITHSPTGEQNVSAH